MGHFITYLHGGT